MRVLAVADHVDPLVYSPAIKERFPDIDLVLGAGDLPMDYYDYIVSCLNRPLVFVFGNHNLRHLEFFRGKTDALTAAGAYPHAGSRRMPGGIYVDRKVRKIRGLLIAGLVGSPWYNGGPNQFTENQMKWTLWKLQPLLWWNRGVDIVISHAPPRLVHDAEDRCHRGFKSFHALIRRFSPSYFIHGHIHARFNDPSERMTIINQTKVVNSYGHYLFEIDTGRATE